MSDKIKLDSIIDGMEMQLDDMRSFLNKESKEIVFISDEDLRVAEDEEDLGGFPEWQRECIELAEEILYGDDWIGLPSNFEINEYNIMESFCLSIRDEKLSNALYYSIKGKGAFRRFKENIRRYDLDDHWYEFREQALRVIAIEWCEGNHIDYEDDDKWLK